MNPTKISIHIPGVPLKIDKDYQVEYDVAKMIIDEVNPGNGASMDYLLNPHIASAIYYEDKKVLEIEAFVTIPDPLEIDSNVQVELNVNWVEPSEDSSEKYIFHYRRSPSFGILRNNRVHRVIIKRDIEQMGSNHPVEFHTINQNPRTSRGTVTTIETYTRT